MFPVTFAWLRSRRGTWHIRDFINLLPLVQNLHKLPSFELAQWPGLLDRHLVADTGLVLLVVNVKLLREGDHLPIVRSEEHTSELQSHSFISYAVFCLKK